MQVGGKTGTCLSMRTRPEPWIDKDAYRVLRADVISPGLL